EQWQSELRQKFHIEAVVVRPGTVSAIEREIERERGGALLSRSLFEERRFVVVSIDYIKSDRRRPEFVRACPEFVIVDEAHGVAESAGRSAQQQRHSLVADLAYARDVVQSAEGQSAFHQRLSWWAALGLLRCASSSPAAAAAALRTRAPRLDGIGPAAADELAAPAVLDLEQSNEAAQDDSTP